MAAKFIEITVIEKPKRTRKTHHKVRTGCITCKIRRKKCDEAKPACKRCTSTGRKCDGYVFAAEDEWKDDKNEKSAPGSDSKTTMIKEENSPKALIAKDVSLELSRPPKNEFFTNEQDFFCFDLFRAKTVPEFAAYFDSSIWRSFMIRACFLHPTVLQAAVAVGAVHRRFELGISPEAFQYCDISEKQYQKAVRCLQRNLSSANTYAPEVNMVVSMLLAIYETFQSNYEIAQAHMAMGIKLLMNRQFKTTHSESQYKSVDVSQQNLRDLFKRLEKKAYKIFKSHAQIHQAPLEHPSSTPSFLPIPNTFTSIFQARDILFTESFFIWHAWDQLSLGFNTGFSAQHTHIARLLDWSIAYANFSKQDAQAIHPPQHPKIIDRKKAHLLLKTYREALYLILLVQLAFHEPDTGKQILPLCIPPETCQCHTSCRDWAERRTALNTHFARLLVLSEPLFTDDEGYKTEPRTHDIEDDRAISVDSGIGPLLYMGVRDHRSTKIGHQVTSLLETPSFSVPPTTFLAAGERDKVKSEEGKHGSTLLEKKGWETLGIYGIAEKMSSIEEHAILQAGVFVGDSFVAGPEIGGGADRTKYVDVTAYVEEKKVLVRYIRQDEVWGGLVWTQQLFCY